MQTIVPVEVIERRILLIRGQKVMLDADLAEIYGVTTKRLNEQVKRNMGRFPADFAFQLTTEEWKTLKAQDDEPDRSQFATGPQKHRPASHRRYLLNMVQLCPQTSLTAGKL